MSREGTLALRDSQHTETAELSTALDTGGYSRAQLAGQQRPSGKVSLSSTLKAKQDLRWARVVRKTCRQRVCVRADAPGTWVWQG